jgi:hypothetical protein
MFVNYEHHFTHKGKHIFVPNDDCVRRGEALIRYCSARTKFPPYFYHYQPGGHVAALHRHLDNRLFFRIDIENFYYSISRRRVASALHEMGYSRARDYAKWSCVRNPTDGPTYALPIGFVQSPVLASITLLRSRLPDAIARANARGVFVSVYFDDFIGSAMDEKPLQEAFEDILHACDSGALRPNKSKLVGPTHSLEAFNCSLAHGHAAVTSERIAKFHDDGPNAQSVAGFELYCARVTSANR